jgi:hypothetical protein
VPRKALTIQSMSQGLASAVLSASGAGMAKAPTGGVPPVVMAASAEGNTKEGAHGVLIGETTWLSGVTTQQVETMVPGAGES